MPQIQWNLGITDTLGMRRLFDVERGPLLSRMNNITVVQWVRVDPTLLLPSRLPPHHHRHINNFGSPVSTSHTTGWIPHTHTDTHTFWSQELDKTIVDAIIPHRPTVSGNSSCVRL